MSQKAPVDNQHTHRPIDYSVKDLTFRYAKLGNEAGVLGAGLLVLEWAFEIPLLSPPKFVGGREASVRL